MKQLSPIVVLPDFFVSRKVSALLLLLITAMVMPDLTNRIYAQTYCIPSATNACTTNLGNEAISNFTLDSINNNTSCSPINYIDYSSVVNYPNLETTLNSPGTYPYVLTAEHADFASPYSVDIWIDLNNNGSFDDPGEWVAHRPEATDCAFLCTNVVKSGTLTIPSGVTSGTKRLRVRLVFSGEDENDNNPCDTIDFGEAEDYRVIVIGATAINSVSIGAITPLSYCAGSPISIPYTATGSYQAGNVFTAQLSDSTGSFTSPVSIGSIVDTVSGIISGTIPANTPHGTGYVIQIVASNPSTTSATNSAAITINVVEPVSVSIQANPQSSICMGTSVMFTATPGNGGTSPAYQWQINGNSTGPNSATFTSNALHNNDTVTCILTSNAACTTGSPFTSNPIIMSVSATAGAGTITAQKDTLCSGDQASLMVTGSSGNVQWQSSFTGSNFSDINGANDTSYSTTLAQTTFFRVHTSGGTCNDTSSALQLIVNSVPPPPNLTTHDSLICSSDSTQLCASGGFTGYQWSTGATSTCTYVRNAGGYWVTATAANGCSVVSGHLNVVVFPVPSVSIVVQGDTLSSFNSTGYQWFRNDSIISGATNSFYIAQSTGSYSVQVTDSSGCKTMSSATPITINGIEELPLNSNLEIFPNPVAGSFNIRYTGNGSENFHVSIINIMGEKVLENILTLNSHNTVPVNVSQLPAGAYLVQLQSGKDVMTTRIVIQ